MGENWSKSTKNRGNMVRNNAAVKRYRANIEDKKGVGISKYNKDDIND